MEVPFGSVVNCYSLGTVVGDRYVGGLSGYSRGQSRITCCYSAGAVSGNGDVGGLAGYAQWSAFLESTFIACFWDTQSSGRATSAGGRGQTTAQMLTASTFAPWGACETPWTIDEGRDYPRLAWEGTPGEVIIGPTYGGGAGTAQDPYLIFTAQDIDLIGLCWCDWDKHFKVMADIDMSAFDGKDGTPAFNIIGTYENAFSGVFDGNGHTISHLMIAANGRAGLFGQLAYPAEVKDLGVVDVNITGTPAGGLVGCNDRGIVTRCYSTGAVSGTGGLTGGLVGENYGNLTYCYSTCTVAGGHYYTGGLVGYNLRPGSITQSYSSGHVTGSNDVGGLVGRNYNGTITACFWDIETSGQVTSAGGTARTTAEMRKSMTFLEAGWDFVDETENGPKDIWWIDEGKDYPRLWWEGDGASQL